MTEPAKCHCGSSSWERNIEESRYTCCSCKRPLWMPIETAPKDDAEILVWDDGFVWIAHWEARDGFWSLLGDGITVDPTHWMLLPEPPK